MSSLNVKNIFICIFVDMNTDEICLPTTDVPTGILVKI